MKLILLGKQTSGKGTQAKILKAKLKIPHISTGDIFRDNVKKQTILGKKVKKLIDSGTLVPDSLTTAIIKDRLKASDCKKGFILDGYPRNIVQAKSLSKFTDIDKVIEIAVPCQEATKRMLNRRTCTKCGHIYNLYTMPKPKNPNVCDKDHSKLFQREDDTRGPIKKRLDTYKKETLPLKKYYKDRLAIVKGTNTIKQVTSNILAILK